MLFKGNMLVYTIVTYLVDYYYFKFQPCKCNSYKDIKCWSVHKIYVCS